MFESRLVVLRFETVDDGRRNRIDSSKGEHSHPTTRPLSDFLPFDIDANGPVLEAFSAYGVIGDDDANRPDDRHDQHGERRGAHHDDGRNDNRKDGGNRGDQINERIENAPGTMADQHERTLGHDAPAMILEKGFLLGHRMTVNREVFRGGTTTHDRALDA